jgi:hypothetical protein
MIRTTFKIALFFLFLFSFWFHQLQAQDGPKTIRDEEKKIQFIVPSGWSVTEKDVGYILGLYDTDGFILIKVEKFKSLKDLKSAMNNGIAQEDGSVLTVTTELNNLGKQGVAGMYEGTVDGKEVKGFLMALMPPSGKKAAISIVVAPKDHFNQSHMDELKSIVKSIVFL